MSRSLVIWCPDWPVYAATRGRTLPPSIPVALVDRGEIHSCSAAARQEGVRRGLRLREAQARCPTLLVLRYDPALDARAFEPVLAALEALVAGVQPLRPGMCAVAARGVARYYGGERAAAIALAAVLAEQGVPVVRVGIADDPFTAEQAARAAGAEAVIVAEGGSPGFLAPLPLSVLDEPQLAALLHRLGVATLGEFAVMPSASVGDRFGPRGAMLHALAGGRDARGTVPRARAEEYEATVSFDTPVDRVDQLAFALRMPAEELVQRLVQHRLVCTALRVEVSSEEGHVAERVWLHPRSFSANDIVDRVRWQLQGVGGADSRMPAPVSRVRVTPETLDAVGRHEHGLWGSGPDERVHQGMARVQGMVGHTGVLTAVIGGGRSPAERQTLTPWGDRPRPSRSPAEPWPGRLPEPPPSTVFAVPREVAVLSARGEPVTVDERGRLSDPPGLLGGTATAPSRITAWAGPWSVAPRWWGSEPSRRHDRFQAVDADGVGWLLVHEEGRWSAEGRYD